MGKYVNAHRLNKGCRGCLMIFLLAVGAFLLLFGVVGFSEGVSKEQDRIIYITMGLIFSGLSLACLTAFVVLLRQMVRINRYVALVGTQKSVSIKQLADRIGKNTDKVLKELRKIMVSGVFSDAHIDEDRMLLLFPTTEDSVAAIKVVDCPFCGGKVEVMAGYSAKCEYCGNTINDNI